MSLPSDPTSLLPDAPERAKGTRMLVVLAEGSFFGSYATGLSALLPDVSLTFSREAGPARKAVAAGGFDVVVTEQGPLDWDGVALLELVERCHPGAVRIFFGRRDAIRMDPRLLRVAHQLIGEDMTPQVLIDLASQTARLLPLIGDESMKRALGSLTSLPPAPKLYHQLTQLLEASDSSVDDVAALLSRDPAICAKLLQLTNSAFFARRGRTLELRPAIVRLGMNTIRSLLLSVELFDKTGGFAQILGSELDAAQVAAHELGELAERLSQGSQWSGQAYVAGLLADIGQMLLLATRGKEWRECRRAAQRDRRPIADVEREQFGVSHAEVGAYLLGIWGLPFALVEAVAHHHTPTQKLVTHFNLAAVTAIAASIRGRVPIDEPWLVGMKVRTKVELLKNSLAV